MLKSEPSVTIVAVFDDNGTMLYRGVRTGYEEKLKRNERTLTLSLLRAQLVLTMADLSDDQLGETQYFLTKRSKYSSIAFHIPDSSYSLRLTFNSKSDASALYERVISRLRD
jgi:hypothetical protein